MEADAELESDVGSSTVSSSSAQSLLDIISAVKMERSEQKDEKDPFSTPSKKGLKVAEKKPPVLPESVSCLCKLCARFTSTYFFFEHLV